MANFVTTFISAAPGTLHSSVRLSSPGQRIALGAHWLCSGKVKRQTHHHEQDAWTPQIERTEGGGEVGCMSKRRLEHSGPASVEMSCGDEK